MRPPPDRALPWAGVLAWRAVPANAIGPPPGREARISGLASAEVGVLTRTAGDGLSHSDTAVPLHLAPRCFPPSFEDRILKAAVCGTRETVIGEDPPQASLLPFSRLGTEIADPLRPHLNPATGQIVDAIHELVDWRPDRPQLIVPGPKENLPASTGPLEECVFAVGPPVPRHRPNAENRLHHLTEMFSGTFDGPELPLELLLLLHAETAPPGRLRADPSPA
jgi:hypothetical protein